MRGSPTRATGTAINTSRGPAVPRQCPGEQDRGRGAGTHRRVRQAGAGPAAGGRLVPVGSLPLGAPVGHGAGGLQRRRRGVVLPAARPRPLPGLPVGRGRPRGLLRRRAAAVPRPRAVERSRPDPEGADLRPDRRRGQPRRGRQGVLVVPRRAAQPRLEPVALPLPARRLPLRTAGRGERAARAARPCAPTTRSSARSRWTSAPAPTAPRPSCCSATTRATPPGSSGCPARATRRTASTTTSWRAPPPSTPRRAAASARRGTGSRWAAARPWSCGCGSPPAAGRTSTTWSPPAAPRPTSSTPT